MSSQGIEFADGDQVSAAYSTAEPRSPGSAQGPIDFPDGLQVGGASLSTEGAGDMPPKGGVSLDSPAGE